MTKAPWRCLVLVGMVVTLQACASSQPYQAPTNVPSIWPVDRSRVLVTGEFGAPRGRSRHQGIDLATTPGTPVWATADGGVVFAGKERRYGRMVLIDHGGGYRTRYAHLKKIETKKGRRIARGDLIGRVGKSGNASGAHLHYEVLRNGVPVDPRAYLD